VISLVGGRAWVLLGRKEWRIVADPSSIWPHDEQGLMQPNAFKEMIDDDLTCNGLAYLLGCHRLKTTLLEGEHETSVMFPPCWNSKIIPKTQNKNNNKTFSSTTLKKDKEKDKNQNINTTQNQKHKINRRKDGKKEIHVSVIELSTVTIFILQKLMIGSYYH